MTGRQERIQALIEAINDLQDGQLGWIEDVVNQLKKPCQFILHTSDLITYRILQDFGDALRIHHAFSAEPFSKDKFEYVLERVMLLNGHSASRPARTNPGHDITIDRTAFSLKTQADKDIKVDKIHISKFMELGSGEWGADVEDLKGLRDQFFNHMASYDRILTLRALKKGQPDWHYELVEIPKDLLLEAKHGEFEMSKKSKAETAKPGFCRVRDGKGNLKFQLYFDGAGERKLQIQHLDKKLCQVHAEWIFTA